MALSLAGTSALEESQETYSTVIFRLFKGTARFQEDFEIQTSYPKFWVLQQGFHKKPVTGGQPLLMLPLTTGY